MACVYNRSGDVKCKNAASGLFTKLQLVDGFCDEHLALVRSRLKPASKKNWGGKENEPLSGVQGLYIEDYIKLFALMLNKPRCRDAMSSLNSEILAGYKQRGAYGGSDERFHRPLRKAEEDYVRLSRVLEYYEGLCWFPTTHRVYTGSLTSENYVQSIALGYMPKDAGAGARHGEYSHRLQWHVVMRVMTQDFSQPFDKGTWNHSPLALFTSLGSDWAMQAGAWGLIFDNGDGFAYDNPAILNMELCGNFKWSSNKAHDDGEQWRAQNQLLSSNAARRTKKRLAIFEFGKEMYRTLARQGDGLTEAGLEMELIGLLEKWKKLGKPSFWKDTPQIKNEVGNTSLNKIARAAWKHFNLQAVPDLYDQDETETNALRRRGDKAMTQELIASRTQASALSLNVAQYVYVQQQGAYPKGLN